VLAGARVTISYRGTTETKEFSIDELARLPQMGFDNVGGFWRGLSFNLIDRQGRPYVDVTYPGPETIFDVTEDQWNIWLQLADPRIILTFRHRQAIQSIPVFNRLEELAVNPRYEGPVILNGQSTVYQRPEGAVEFLRDHVRISATYSLGVDRTQTATREDVRADFLAGTVRRGPEITNFAPNQGGQAGAITSILTAQNSSDFTVRGRTQNAIIEFTAIGPGVTVPIAGERTRTVRTPIGMINYVDPF